jgi:hypothetical protein
MSDATSLSPPVQDRRTYPDNPDNPDSTSSAVQGGILGQILHRFQLQTPAEQAVTVSDVVENNAPTASEPAEAPPQLAPVGWDEARALAVQAASNARLDAAVAAMSADAPHRQAWLNVLTNERSIVAGLIAKHDPILWGWLVSLECLLARWKQEDAAERRQKPQGR